MIQNFLPPMRTTTDQNQNVATQLPKQNLLQEPPPMKQPTAQPAAGGIQNFLSMQKPPQAQGNSAQAAPAGGFQNFLPPTTAPAQPQQGGMIQNWMPPSNSGSLGQTQPDNNAAQAAPAGGFQNFLPMQKPPQPQQGGMQPAGGDSNPAPQQQPQPMPQNFLPPQRQQGGPTQMPPQAQGTPQGGIEQQALNGGGPNNKQSINNFMTALQGVGAGGNNRFMGGSQAPQQSIGNMVDPNIAYANNGGSANNTSSSGFNTNTSQSNTSGGTAGVGFGAATPPPPLPGYQQNQQGGPGLDLQNRQSFPVDTSQQSATTPHQTSVVDPSLYSGWGQMPMSNQQQTLVSDENLKTNINPGDRSVHQFLNTIGAHNYEYKNPELDGRGVFTSPMAQELEKTELGKQAVIDTPRGKMVNYGRLGAVNLAAASVLNREQQRLQAQIDELKKQFKFNKGK